MTLPADIEAKKSRAAAFFRRFRDDLTAELNRIEIEDGVPSDRPAGTFDIKPWTRPIHLWPALPVSGWSASIPCGCR